MSIVQWGSIAFLVVVIALVLIGIRGHRSRDREDGLDATGNALGGYDPVD